MSRLPLYADIDVRCLKYTFSHPGGLLFATQFAQIVLVITEKAAFENMRVKGFVQMDCAFAGQSLGEYSALASESPVRWIWTQDLLFTTFNFERLIPGPPLTNLQIISMPTSAWTCQ